jgi:hypothetical protein
LVRLQWHTVIVPAGLTAGRIALVSNRGPAPFTVIAIYQPADVARESDVELSVPVELALELATLTLTESDVALLAATDAAVPAETPFESAVDTRATTDNAVLFAIDVFTESDVTLDVATDVLSDTETTRLSAVDVPI